MCNNFIINISTHSKILWYTVNLCATVQHATNPSLIWQHYNTQQKINSRVGWGISGWRQSLDASHIIAFIRSTVLRNPSPLAMRQGPCKYYLNFSQKLHSTTLNSSVAALFSFQSRSCFLMVAKILHYLQSTLSHQILIIFFLFRMRILECMENLEIRFFGAQAFRGSFWTMRLLHQFMCSYSVFTIF